MSVLSITRKITHYKQWKSFCIPNNYLIIFTEDLRHIFDFPCGSNDKESACNAGDLGWISELGRSPGEAKGYLFQYSGLENSMGCIVHIVYGVVKSRTRLSNFHFHYDTFSTVVYVRSS